MSVILTGIKPTGNPHIGNYVGVIKPAIESVNDSDEFFFFIADYHALNSVQNPDKLRELTRVVAATWIAMGLNPDKCHIYRQSDIPEIFELDTVLNNFTPKGWMNKAHAYKAATDKNSQANKPVDDNINMGLYNYPILMASDILMFNTDFVPVGKDQVQHVEIARDIAGRFNSTYGSDNVLTLPQHKLVEDAAEIPGIDGRKMSKSYTNVIPLFASREQWQKSLAQIVTDSAPKGEGENYQDSVVVRIFQAISSKEGADALVAKLSSGEFGWKEAKDQLLQRIIDMFEPRAEKFNQLIASPDELDKILKNGSEKVRPLAQENLEKIRRTIGVA